MIQQIHRTSVPSCCSRFCTKYLHQSSETDCIQTWRKTTLLTKMYKRGFGQPWMESVNILRCWRIFSGMPNAASVQSTLLCWIWGSLLERWVTISLLVLLNITMFRRKSLLWSRTYNIQTPWSVLLLEIITHASYQSVEVFSKVIHVHPWLSTWHTIRWWKWPHNRNMNNLVTCGA